MQRSSNSSAIQRRHRLDLFRWLVGFTQTGLRDQSPDVLAALPDRLLAAAQVGGRVVPANLIPRRLLPRLRRRWDPGVSLSSDGYRMGLWTKRDTIRFHRQLATILDKLLPPTPASAAFERGVAFIPAPLGRVYLSREDGRIRRWYGAAEGNLIWFGMAELLEEFGGLLTLCAAPGCGRIFVRERRQQYCSASCSQKVRSATWYQKHGKKARAARRRRYTREVQARLPGVKVGRHRPRSSR